MKEDLTAPLRSVEPAAQKKILDRALDRLAAGQALSGLENCHVPGLFSIVLENRESDATGMLRIFYAGPDCKIEKLFAKGDFSLLPHNHRQDITLWGLFGKADNWTAEFGWGMGMHEYRFGSALLDGSFSLKRTRELSGVFRKEEIGVNGVRLPAAQVHTVAAEPESAWVVEEGQISTAPSLCYSFKKNKTLDSAGLYLPMSPDHLSRICNRILDLRAEGSATAREPSP